MTNNMEDSILAITCICVAYSLITGIKTAVRELLTMNNVSETIMAAIYIACLITLAFVFVFSYVIVAQ